MESCWLSIIIPHYNTPDRLCRLLDSIGKQRDVQVIVIDDHSDQYQAELSKCQDSYSHVLFLQTKPGKKGAGAARNEGLLHAEGDWLLFADADDLFLPGWYDAVAGYRETEADIVFFMPEGRKDDGSISTRHLPYRKLMEDYISNRYGGEERLRFRFTVPWSKLIRTEIVRDYEITFDEIQYSNDVMFSAKVGFYASRVAADRRPIYCVVEREGSLTNVHTGEIYLRRMRVICERERYLSTRLPEETMDACRRVNYMFSVKDALQKGYGLKTTLGLFKLFREYRLPFAPENQKTTREWRNPLIEWRRKKGSENPLQLEEGGSWGRVLADERDEDI